MRRRFCRFCVLILAIAAAAASAASASLCSLQSATPPLGPAAGGGLVLLELQGDWSPQHLLAVDDSVFAVEDLMPEAGDDPLVIRMPAHAPGDALISSPNCSGLLVYEYYDLSAATLVASTDRIRGAGGSSITITFEGLAIRHWALVRLRLRSVPATPCPEHSDVVVPGEHLEGEKVFFRTNNLVRTRLCSPGTATAEVAVNGESYEATSLVFTMTDEPAYRALFVYISGISDFGWTYAHNVGRMAVAETFGLSLEALYIESIPEHNEPLLRKSVEKYLPLDMVIITSEGYQGPAEAIAKDYPDTQFVLMSDVALHDPPSHPNFNTAWSTLYEARYLAGIVAGGVLPKDENQICFIKAWDNAEVSRGMNAFLRGAQLLRPDVIIRTVTINSWVDAFLEHQAAVHLLRKGCTLLAHHTDSIVPLEVFVDKGLTVIGSNSDSRIFLGEKVATSPMFDWTTAYLDIIQDGMDNRLGNKTTVYRLAQGAVSIAPMSGYVDTDVRHRVALETARIYAARGAEAVFCGPLYDNKGQLRIPDGQCATYADLSQMTWDLAGVQNDGVLKPSYPDHDPNHVPQAVIIIVYIIYALLTIACIYFAFWVHQNKSTIVVRLAQPFFLYLVLLGCAVGLSTLVPLTFNHSAYDVDLHDPDMEKRDFPALDSACEAQLWLMCTGFAITFPTLFVKTWRIATIMKAGRSLRRVVIKEKDCLVAIAVCLVWMWSVLTAWHFYSPRKYKLFITQRDEYGNPTESYGRCVDSHVQEFGIPLGVFVIGSVIYGNYLGFKCRTNETTNSESKWIVLSLANMLQAFVITYLLTTLSTSNVGKAFVGPAFLTLVVFGGTLGLMFVPKLLSPNLADQSLLPTSTTTNNSQDTSREISTDRNKQHSGEGQSQVEMS